MPVSGLIDNFGSRKRYKALILELKKREGKRRIFAVGPNL